MTNETIRQADAILISVQDVPLSIAEQAVMMGQLTGGIGAAVSGVIMLLAAILMIGGAYLSYKDDTKHPNCAHVACIAGIVALFALICCLGFADMWAKATYTPEYYITKCIGIPLD